MSCFVSVSSFPNKAFALEKVDYVEEKLEAPLTSSSATLSSELWPRLPVVAPFQVVPEKVMHIEPILGTSHASFKRDPTCNTAAVHRFTIRLNQAL